MSWLVGEASRVNSFRILCVGGEAGVGEQEAGLPTVDHTHALLCFGV